MDQNDPDQNDRDRNVPDPNDRDRNVPDPNDRDQNDLDPLERHAATVRQLSNGTNGDDLYIHIATVGNTIQTVNSPMYDTYMSTPCNTAKLGATHSNIQTAQ